MGADFRVLGADPLLIVGFFSLGMSALVLGFCASHYGNSLSRQRMKSCNLPEAPSSMMHVVVRSQIQWTTIVIVS